jgi:hypothetical protein
MDIPSLEEQKTMRFQIKTGLMAVALFALALPLSAYSGFSVGQPVGGADVGECIQAALVYTVPSDGASLFVLREGGTASNDILYSIEDNSKTLGCTFSATGDYDCPGANFQTPPVSNDETVWVIITAYPGGAPGGTHEGWIHTDNTPGLQEDMAPGLEPNVIQRLRLPTATAGVVDTGNPAVDPTSGVDFTFEYLTEFGGNAGTLPCHLGGNQAPIEAANRVFAGFNVYRINVTQSGVDAATSTPMHYLCGPDLTCGNADDGYVGFVALNGDCMTGLCIDDPTSTAGSGPGGIEVRGGTEPNVIFSDSPLFGTNDPNMDADQFTYVYQPVLKGDPSDTWNGFPALDLDGDGIPEFVDPGGNGLGLTANGTSPAEPIILISGDAQVDGGAPTPIEGAVDLTASLKGRGGLDLSFLSSIEGNVVGFHIYRSLGGASYVQATREMIPAVGAPLSKYSWTDNLNVRRIKGNHLQYKVEAVMADGTTQTFGPFDVDVSSLKTPSRERRR